VSPNQALPAKDDGVSHKTFNKLTIASWVRYAWLVEVSVLNNKLFSMNSLLWVHVETYQRRSLAAIR
jgi:hypothetical protein